MSFVDWGQYSSSNTNSLPPVNSISGGGTNFAGNYGSSNSYGSPGGSVLPTGASSVGGNFNWGNVGNTMGAVQGGIGIYNNIMDLLGKSDADKQRDFAKTFTMREWNTKARMHDNQLQMGRNKVAMYNAANPGGNQLSTFDGLKTLGTWGSKPGRVLDAGTQAQYSGNQNPQPPQQTNNRPPYRG